VTLLFEPRGGGEGAKSRLPLSSHRIHCGS